jgi:hypothetical protein
MPYSNQVVAWPGGQGVNVVPQPPTGTVPPSAPNILLPTYYGEGEVPPPQQPLGVTNIEAGTVTAIISGPVTVAGTVAISSGTVNVGTVAGSISIAAGQVIQVENVPSGSVTITGSVAISSGTVDIGTISGDVTLAANQVVQVENTAGGSVTVAGTVAISSGTVNIGTISGAVTIASGSVDIGSGNITIVGGQGSATNVSTDAPPVSVGTLTVLTGNDSATLTANIGNTWTGVVVQVVDEGDTGITDYEVKVTILDAAGGVIFQQLLFDSVPGWSVVVPVTGNIDGGAGTVRVDFYTNSYAVTKNTVVAHVGALLGTGVQYVATPTHQPISVQVAAGEGITSTTAFVPALATTWYDLVIQDFTRTGLFLYANWSNAAYCAVGIAGNVLSFVLGPGAYYEMPNPILSSWLNVYFDVLPAGGFAATPALWVTQVTQS